MNSVIGYGAPYDFDHINVASASYSPSEIHIRNTKLWYFYRKYFLQKAMAVFDWKLPKSWSREYFLYVLYCWGFIAVVNTDKFGVIPQGCGLTGYDVFYRPTNAIITNPLLKGILQPRIDKECALIKLQPNYSSIMDIVCYYSDLCAVTAETALINIMNSKLSYVFGAKNKSFAESFKRMFDNVQAGEPAVVIDKDLFNDDGSVAWQTFTQDLKGNYIAGQMLDDLRKYEQEFDSVVGIPNANTQKKERMIVDEVNANNFETECLSQLWLDTLSEGVEQARKLFGIPKDKFNVKRRESAVMSQITAVEQAQEV